MIGLMDCNNFFVSCERLFRPDLKNKPVSVLSSNDGCIVARSQEVKDLGIPMGIPYFKVKDFCREEDIILFSSNFRLYRDISARVMHALKEEYESCEIYSVDEAFFKLGEGVEIEEINRLRDIIMKKTGIPVSIGVAPTKTLAKLASTVAKKGSGTCILHEYDKMALLKDISCGIVWGMGRQTSLKLTKEGVSTVSDFLDLEQSYIKKLLGLVGERLYLELSGTPVYKVGEKEDSLQKSYTSSRSFASTTHNKKVLMSALTHHASHLAQKLRSEKCVTSTISILARGSLHAEYSHRKSSERSMFTMPTNDTFVILKEISKLLDRLYDNEIPYKKVGVVLSGIHPETFTQASLFGEKNKESKTSVVNNLMDSINGKGLSGILRFGTSLHQKKWKEKKELKSQEYTTQWSEIPNVKAI